MFIFHREEINKALDYYKRALVIEDRLAPEELGFADTNNALAKSYRKLNQLELAEFYFERSLEALEAQLQNLGGSDHTKSGFFGDNEIYFREFIDHLQTAGKPVFAFNTTERARAKILHQMLSERDLIVAGDEIPPGLDKSLRQVAYRFETAQRELGEISIKTSPKQFESVRNQLFDLRREYNDIIEQIRKTSPGLPASAHPNRLT